jgi:phage terminase large subunit
LSDQVKFQFPEKLGFLFKPSRYKIAHGGRGGAKSWNFARALLLEGAEKPTRVLCAREVQKSIKDSVHQLLSDQIDLLGLAGFYRITRDEITGQNGTRFLFSGLSDQTSDSLKSFEGIDRVWVEEAHKVTRRSWDILIPTIRKPDSEIWISLNPELDTDETYVRFVENPPQDAVVVQINWRDNPWFPEVLNREREEFLRQVALGNRTQDEYSNIWEGQCRAAVEGAIYASEVAKLQQDRRLCRVAYDPMLPVHRVWDLGWNDAMVVGMWQRSPMGLMLIDSLIVTHTTYADVMALLASRQYRWGHDLLPHDGKHKNPQTGESAEILLRRLGAKPFDVPDVGIEAGIKAVRQAFGRLWIDESTGDNRRVLNALKRYRRVINSTTNEPGPPLHDENSHAADMVRYAVVSADLMANDEPIKDPYSGFRNAASF